MKIVIITKSNLDFIPPVISATLILNDLGHNVHVITSGASNSVLEQMNHRSITVDILPYTSAISFIGKAIEYLKFRYYVKQLLLKIDFDYLWIEGAITIRSLGTFIQKYKYILQISELHNDSKSQMNAISKVIKNASVVFMPEYNRTIFYQVWFKLQKRPVVLPNKPYFIPSSSELLSLTKKYKIELELFTKYKVILYQGMIFEERDLSNFILAIKELGEEYKLVLLGRDRNMLSKYRKLDPDLVHINFISAPDYLVFTNLCHMGIVTYDPMELNTAYCAPNKIYEYSAFGKPIVGNNIPGLQCLIDNKCGVLVAEDNKDAIKKAIIDLDTNYESYSKNALLFYQNTDNRNIIKNAIESL